MGVLGAQATEDHHNPVRKDHGLDLEGGGGDNLLALRRGMTSDLGLKGPLGAVFLYD